MNIRIFLPVLILFVFFACNTKNEEVAQEQDNKQKNKILAVEPFLVPDVENIFNEKNFTGEEATVRDLIIEYNRKVALAQINFVKLEDLKDITTKREFRRIYSSIERERTEGLIMSTTLRNLTFSHIALNEGSATVRTIEDWFFEYRDLETGKIAQPLKDFEYEVHYSLLIENGRWLVDKIEFGRVAEYMPLRATPKRIHASTGNNSSKGEIKK